MELLKNFHNADIEDLIEKFSKWESDNLILTYGKRENNVQDTYGLPYTSSGIYAGLWCTNVQAVYAEDSSLNFDGIGYNTELQPVAFFTRLDDAGNEVEDVVILF